MRKFYTVIAMIAVIVAFNPFNASANAVCNADVISTTIESYEDGSTAQIAYVELYANNILKVSYVGEYSADRLNKGCAYVTGGINGTFVDGIISQPIANGDVTTVKYMVISTDESGDPDFKPYVVNMALVK